MTVAPLFLFPFCGEEVIAKVLLWFSLLGAVWNVMSPSVKGNERPHDARLRFAYEVVRDPLFWAGLVLVAFAGIRSQASVRSMAALHSSTMPRRIHGRYPCRLLRYCRAALTVLAFCRFR